MVFSNKGVAVFFQVGGGGGKRLKVGVERLWGFVHAGRKAGCNHLGRRFAVFDIGFTRTRLARFHPQPIAWTDLCPP